MNTDQRMLNSDGLEFFSLQKSYIVNPCSIFKNKIVIALK